MTDFKPGDLGYITVWMVDGPLDGIAYNDMPILPDGKPAGQVSIPQAELQQSGLYAVYGRRLIPAPDGRWVYDYVREVADATPIKPTPFPKGTVVKSAPDVFTPAVADEDAAESENPQSVAEFMPADRFIIEQAWWVASQLCRRHSELHIREVWPLDGFYHGLEIGGPGSTKSVFLNFHGSVHVHGDDEEESNTGLRTWQLLGAETPYEYVEFIERRIGWRAKGSDPATPRSLTYRVLSACLTRKLNDKDRCTVQSGIEAGGGDAYEEPTLDFLNEFGEARGWLDGPAHRMERLSRTWVLKLGERNALVLTDNGVLHRRSAGPLELMSIYRSRRNLDDLVDIVVGAATT